MKKNPGRKERRRLYFSNRRSESTIKSKLNERHQKKQAQEVRHAS